MSTEHFPYVVEPMRLEDLDEVMAIEKMAFPTPWSLRAYRWELTANERACYLVVRQRLPQGERPPTGLGGQIRRALGRQAASRSPVLGYGGFWLVIDEAHIGTLAVHPHWRRRGLGSLLLAALLDKAVEKGAIVATLEVRVSNIAAQNLYRAFGFEQVGLRPGYYQDNGEDALIMTTPPLTTAPFQRRLSRLKEDLTRRLAVPVT
ncbi:MAG: ribosomal protein S18-alanine N-acetyltransferase [Anaerolineae bacterium]|nr:ribosomal protein S18-alanine N-acetyltransferase [Anaerolineae bacterium]